MARTPTEASGFLPLHPLEFRILMSLTAGPSYGTRIVHRLGAHGVVVGKEGAADHEDCEAQEAQVARRSYAA